MKIASLYQRDQVTFSLEFFPPKTVEAESALMQVAAELRMLGPSFFTVTYGAGGSTREKTIRIVDRLRQEIGVETMSHLTTVGQSKSEVAQVLEEMRRLGIENVLALRGDPPKGETEFRPRPDGFGNATELVQFIRERYSPEDFCIAVAGNPEGHPEATSRAANWEHLKAKIDAGGQFVLTQLFWNNDYFYEFRDACVRLGIGVPLVPGVMPLLSPSQVQRFSALGGAKVPQTLAAELEGIGDDGERAIQLGIDYATRQCQDLIRHGVKGLHLYCLNRSRSVTAVLRNLGLA